MVSLNLSLLESELGAFRRQKRLQHAKSFPVSWQPLVKGANLAEGARITLLGESASDIEWQQKVLQYQQAPFWQRWYLRVFTSQVAQLELYFYARFSLFLTLLRQTSSPSLYRVRQQHLYYYLGMAERTLPWFSPLVRAVKRAFAIPPKEHRNSSRSPSSIAAMRSQDSSSTTSEKLSLDGEYHYTYLRNQLQPRRKRVFLSQRGIQPVPIRPHLPESADIPESIVHHYQHMKLSFLAAILSETDVFRRQAWISRQHHAIRSIRQRADAIGLRLPKNLPSQAPAFRWPWVPPSFSFSQRLNTFLPACRQQLLTLYQHIRKYSRPSKPATPSLGSAHSEQEPELKHFQQPVGKGQESEQKHRKSSAEHTHSLSGEFDQVFRQFLNRLIASPTPNFNIINTFNQQRIRAMQRIQDKFSSVPGSKAKRLDLHHELQQRKQRFRKLAKQYPSLTPFTTQQLESWLHIHQQRLTEIKDYQTQYAQWLEIKRPPGIIAFATFHATPPQSLQEELWQSLGHFYRDLLAACQSYVVKSRRVKKQTTDESTFLLLQKGFHTLRQLTREWFKEIPATKAAPFNKQVVQWEAAILNSLPRLMQIKTDSKEINEFKKTSTPPSAPTIKLPEDAYMEFHQPPFRQYLEYYFVCGLFAINIEEKDHKLIHTQLADGVEALSSALQRSRTLSSSSDETGKTLTHLAEYAAHAEFQLRHPQPPLDVPDQQKIRWQCATEYMQTHGRALRQQWLAAPSLSKNHSESHSEEKQENETKAQADIPSTRSADFMEPDPVVKNHAEIAESKYLTHNPTDEVELKVSQESLSSDTSPPTLAQTALPLTTLEVLTAQVFPQLLRDLCTWESSVQNLEEAQVLKQRFQEFCTACRKEIDSSEHLTQRLQRVELFTDLQLQLLDKGHSILLETFINGSNIFDDPVFSPPPARTANGDTQEDIFKQSLLIEVELAAVFSINLKELSKPDKQLFLDEQLRVSMHTLRRAVHFDKYADTRNSLAKDSPPLLSHLPPPTENENGHSPSALLYKNWKNQLNEQWHLITERAKETKNFSTRYNSQLPLYQPFLSKKEWSFEYAESLMRGFQRKIQIQFYCPRLMVQHLRGIQHPEFIPPNTRLSFPSRKVESGESRQSSNQLIIDFRKEFNEVFEKHEKERKEAEALRQKEKIEAEALRQKEKIEAEALRQKEKIEAEALRQKEKAEADASNIELRQQMQFLMQMVSNLSRSITPTSIPLADPEVKHSSSNLSDPRLPASSEKENLLERLPILTAHRDGIIRQMQDSTQNSKLEKELENTEKEISEIENVLKEEKENKSDSLIKPGGQKRTAMPSRLDFPDVGLFTTPTPGPASASSETPPVALSSSTSSSSSMTTSTTSSSSESTTETTSSNSFAGKIIG